jgi:HK97 family phage major capsid protein
MGQTDQMLAQYVAEIEERQQFVDGIFQAAGGKDLTDEQFEMVDDTRKRMSVINDKMAPLLEMRRISGDSAARVAEIAKYMSNTPGPPQAIEYRSAGEYIVDVWRSGLGVEEATQRLETYTRAASHQTTADNPGLIPTPILGPVVNFIDAARPLVSALGPRQIPSASFSRPKVTQHTTVAVQSAEKGELSSQKMTISKLAVTPSTYGGYVNVSRQDVDWSTPQVMDIVIQDLANQYAIVTEQVAVQAIYSGGSASGGTIASGSATSDQVAAAIWTAAGRVYTATKGAGRLLVVCSPDVLGIIGPLFAPINPIDAQSTGFVASQYGQGILGAVSGVSVVVSAGFASTKQLMVMSTAAAEVYEDRIGSLQVVEPSVLGIQVAYAGYFADLIIEAAGIEKITVT